MRSPLRSASILLLGLLTLLPLIAHSQPAPAPEVTAIDILLLPDDAMLARARSINRQLRQNYPQGYPLDATHVPHITLIQRYVRAHQLNAVKDVVTRVLQDHPISSLHLTVSGYIASTWGQTGILLYKVEPTLDLLALEAAIRDAVQPYAVQGGTAEAFVRSPGETIDPKTIQWVEEFVPAHSGQNYDPHITLGLARPDLLAKLKVEPFQPIAFRPAALAIYALGNVGTAQKNLASWPVR